MAATPVRLPVLRTYKLYVGGAFPRTESGRTYLVTDSEGEPLANACRASRKDLRDAVRSARAAAPGWAGRTAMNRGQILYRVAELLEGRADQFTVEVMAAEGVRVGEARALVGRRGGAKGIARLKAKADAHATNILPVIEAIRAENKTSMKGIADELNKRGILTPNGGQWWATSVCNLLSRTPQKKE